MNRRIRGDVRSKCRHALAGKVRGVLRWFVSESIVLPRRTFIDALSAGGRSEHHEPLRTETGSSCGPEPQTSGGLWGSGPVAEAEAVESRCW
jgi:hypothetical protein